MNPGGTGSADLEGDVAIQRGLGGDNIADLDILILQSVGERAIVFDGRRQAGKRRRIQLVHSL